MQTIEQLRRGQLSGIAHLKLSCGLTAFPREILDLADTLESLDLSGNFLSELPDDFARLTKLRVVFCSQNQFTELPRVLGSCPELSMVGFKANRIRDVPPQALPKKLRWLILTDNELKELPGEIGNCSLLQKLMLAGNRLQSLPVSLAGCDRLELIRIAANQLSELPAWLLALPRLSWLAYAGNPFCAATEAVALTAAPVEDVPWDSLKLEHLLGEGASGLIYRATMRDAGEGARPVAVKLFKGAVTSDGSPNSEMAAAMKAGSHPNLIGSFGRVSDHPSGISALVMQLVDPELKNLAGPPSLDSCTRDIYPAHVSFDMPMALRIAHSIAAAADHLHDRGIMHGDLYGHNILHGGQGHALIGDFGAASFYDVDSRAVADRLQRLEVRAFGCLLEELLDRCDAALDAGEVAKVLNDLKAACLSDEVGLRPPFREISKVLSDTMGRWSPSGAGISRGAVPIRTP